MLRGGNFFIFMETDEYVMGWNAEGLMCRFNLEVVKTYTQPSVVPWSVYYYTIILYVHVYMCI